MSAVIKKIVKVKGMSCAGCEEKIERILSARAGVSKASASFSNGTLTIEYYSSQVKLNTIKKLLEQEGYTIIESEQAEVKQTDKQSKFSAAQFIGLAVILVAGYLVINNTIGFDFIPGITSSMGYGMLFVVGLLTSLHCVAMCGGINISQCVSKTNDTKSASSKIKPSLLYNFGRVTSYTILGGIVGALGSAVSFSGTAKGVVAVLSGVFMVIIGISLLRIFPWINRITPRLPRFLRSKAGASSKGPFVVGLLNGLMPCGPLQAMQLYALGTGSFFAGASSMFFFSLGTVPLMFGLGALSSLLSSKFTGKMLKVSAALVVVLGVVMLNRGLALSGVELIAPSAPKQSTGQVQTEPVADGVQNITSELTAYGYPEITVHKGIPVRWNLKAKDSDLSGCNNVMEIPKYGIEKELKSGDNIIEFTPEEEGTVPYSCWMGMVQSRIHIVA